MTALLNPIGLVYRVLALIALAAALFGYGWLKGAEHGQDRIDAMVGKAATEGVRIATVRGAVTERVITKYLPQVTRIETITETIVNEVPVYVTPADPPMSGGFRVLHDAAAAGRVPDPAGISHAAPAPAQAVASTVASNYGACLANAKQLEGLQEWVRQQQAVK